MKSLILFCAAAIICLAPPQRAASQNERAPKFTSLYTDLKTECSPTAEGEPKGDDTPLRCKGYGVYEIRIDFSAASSHLRVQPADGASEESIALAQQPLHYDAKRKIEWRLADGVPFALIFRVEKAKEGVDPVEMWLPENKTGEALRVKGLKGFEMIDFEVAANDSDANARAREMADRVFQKVREK